MIRCPHCGCQTHDGRVFCPECGKRLVPLKEPEAPKDAPSRKPPYAIIIAAVVVALATGGVGLFSRGGDSRSQRAASSTARPTATVQATATPRPTATVQATATPQPTATASPTATPQPSNIPPQPYDSVSTRSELFAVMRWAVANSQTYVKFTRFSLPDAEAQDVINNFGYYFEEYLIWGDALEFHLSASHQAWKAIQEKTVASLTGEAADIARQAQAVIESIIHPGMTDFEKELAIHDYIINHCDYEINVEGHHTGDVRGFFQYGKCQCSGYADTFWLLGTMAGLEVENIRGHVLHLSDMQYRIDPNGGHAWNMVRLDGKWYVMDATWDDPLSDEPTLVYTYFNLPVAYIEQEREWVREAGPDGPFAQAVDDKYYYAGPDFAARTVDEGFANACRAIDAGRSATLFITDTSLVDAIWDKLNERYNYTIWKTEQPFDGFPFMLCKYDKH